jgi:hypothetical protein
MALKVGLNAQSAKHAPERRPPSDCAVLAMSLPGCLEQKPQAPFGAVDECLKQARGCDIVEFVGKFVSGAHVGDDHFMISNQLVKHLMRFDKVVIIFRQRGELGNLSDRGHLRSQKSEMLVHRTLDGNRENAVR